MIFFSTLFFFTQITFASRLIDSPYPVPSSGLNKSSHLYVISESRLTFDEIILVQCIQGFTARISPTIFIRYHNEHEQHLNSMALRYNIHLEEVMSVNFLLETFESYFNGYVLANSSDNESLLSASSIASLSNLIILTASTQHYASEIRNPLPLIRDTNTMKVKDTWDYYKDQVSTSISILQDPAKLSFLLDYAVMSNSFVWFDADIDYQSKYEILSHMKPASAILGWGGADEGEVVYEISKTSGSYLHAADYAPNLSTYSSYGIKKATQKNYVRPKTHIESKKTHKVSFLMADGDNVQWLLDGFNSSEFYGSDDRGLIPLGWTITPALADLAPSVLLDLYESATENDIFVAGPSGIGYTNMDVMDDRNTLALYSNLTGNSMAKSDLHILNVIAKDYDMNSVSEVLKHGEVDAVFYYLYSAYNKLHGQICFHNEKPIIGGRYLLWDSEFDTIESIAKNLNQFASTDIYSEDGYSLIPVHVWSHSVSDVVKLSKLLNEHIEILTPDQFVQEIAKNVKYKKCASASTGATTMFMTLLIIGIISGILGCALILFYLNRRSEQ